MSGIKMKKLRSLIATHNTYDMHARVAIKVVRGMCGSLLNGVDVGWGKLKVSERVAQAVLRVK